MPTMRSDPVTVEAAACVRSRMYAALATDFGFAAPLPGGLFVVPFVVTPALPSHTATPHPSPAQWRDLSRKAEVKRSAALWPAAHSLDHRP